MSYSPPKYPASIPNTTTDLPDQTDDIDWIEAWIYNYVKKELIAVMTELGVDPAGAEATVAARLTAIEAAGVDESVILNIYLNSFRIAILGSYAIMNMAKGISDEYEDETGIDTTASTNEDYDSANDLYSPVVVAGIELDYMEYATDALAQAAYLTNADITNNIATNPDFELWTGGDAVAPDGWDLGGASATIAKESSIIKVGTYSAKVTRVGTDCALNNTDYLTPAGGIAAWKGKTLTLGMWVYATVADRARLLINDGGTDAASTSSFHTGNSTWQWLTVTRVINEDATYLYFSGYVITGNTSAYFDGARLVIGTNFYSLLSYSEDTIKEQGSYSLKGIAIITSSLNKTLTRTISSPIDLSDYDTISLDIRASRIGSNIKIGIHDSGGTTTEHTANIASADTFQTEEIDISAVTNANKDAIDSIIITIINADAENTFYIDDFKGAGETSLMTLISEKFIADSTPDEARIIIFEEDIDAITLNTDIKAYVSRDDGANYTQITLTDEGDYSGSKRILTGTADISGQPGDTDMVYKIESLNNKDLKIYGTGLSWA